MADINSLPAEYRTKSLESLPTDLQALVIKNIKKKFGLGKSDPEGWDVDVIRNLQSRKEMQDYIQYPQEFVTSNPFIGDPYAQMAMVRHTFKAEIMDMASMRSTFELIEIVTQMDPGIDHRFEARIRAERQLYGKYPPGRYRIRIY